MKSIGSRLWKWGAGLGLVAALCGSPQQAAADLAEGFETGMPTSYATGDYSLGSGTWSFVNVIRGTTKYAGTYSCQLRSSTGAEARTPTLAGGVGTITFWVYSSTSTGGLQVNLSTDGGASWTPATGSPFTGLGSAWAQKTIVVNNASVNKVQFYRTAATISLDAVSITSYSSGPTAPSVTTVAASATNTTAATVNGNVTADGGASVTERGACYKTSAGVAITDNKTAATSNGTGAFSVDLSSLSVNQIYYFKAYASNSVGETLAANELNFTTLANVPAAPTVGNPTSSSLDIAVNENGNPAATEFAIQRTSDSQYLQADGSWGAAAVWATKATWGTKTATGLTPETEYFFQVKARNGANVETAFGSTASGTTEAPPSAIWINPMSAGTPMGSYTLGDTLGEWFVNFEIGQETWNYAQVGLGTAVDGTGYSWGEAAWYENGEGSNKRVRRNLSGFQFTSAANYYVICQARADAGDAYTSKSGNGWSNSTAYPPADLASAYFAVSAVNDPASPTAARSTTSPLSEIDLGWAQNGQSHDVMVVRKLTTESWTEPTQGTAYITGELIGSGIVVYVGSLTAISATELDDDTTYDFKFYSVNNDYYSAGVTAQASTAKCEPDAPTGLDAAEDYTAFTASWEAATGATGYRLDVSTEDDFQAGGLGQLIISEVADPLDQANAKFVELYNGTGAAIDFGSATWYLARQANGGSWANTRLTGTVAAAGTYVVAYNQSSYESTFGKAADQYSGNISGNGDDGYFLVQDGGYATGTVVDAYGVIDQDGTGYAWEYLDKNAVRNADVATPNATWTASEWTIPAGTVNAAAMTPGAHTCTGDQAPSYVAGYSNLAVAGTSQLVDGLEEGTTYYFRVRAEGPGGCPSVDSATASATTLEHLRIEVNAAEVNVREAGEGRFFVRLNQDPGGSVVVNISRSAGDASLGVQSGAARSFNSGSWSTWQAVTLAQAADDGNADNEAATFQVSASGLDAVSVAATALDDDIADNLALAATGATIAGTPLLTSRAGELIDGVHADAANYGYTIWTSTPPGTITLDLKATATVSRVRLLGWDWVHRTQRYQIEYSPDGVNWTLLINASGEDRNGWDDWAVADVALRYLRFEGVSSSANQGVLVSELEVYGTSDMSGLAQPELLSTAVNVREGGEGRFFVRLNKQPAASVVVDVTRSSGTADTTVQSGASLGFTPANWSTWRAVTLAAGADENSDNETATYRISATGRADQFVVATVLDDDIGENLALASGGATIRGSPVLSSRAGELIDGTHADSANYGYTIWTNDPPGTITLDLRDGMTVSRIRLLNWDWVHRVHRYTLESSVDGVNWTSLVDATADDRHGWDDWAVADEVLRYLRFTGVSNSANQGVLVSELEVYGVRTPPPAVEISRTAVNVREGGQGRFFVRLASAPAQPVTFAVSRSAGDASLVVAGGATLGFSSANWTNWQAVTLTQADDGNADGETATIQVSAAGYESQYVAATALDDDIGENVALASGGATIRGSKASSTGLLIDGVHNAAANYGWTVWTNVPPGTMTLDMKAAMTVSRIRLLGWDWTHRTQGYQIESSTDGVNWTLLVDAGTPRHGWDDWAVADASIRYLRFTGLSSSANQSVLVSELEVYGTRPGSRRAAAAAKGSAAAGGPATVLTSDGPEDATGWNAVDGDAKTAWVGQKAGGGYVVVGYEPAQTLTGLEVDLAEGSLGGLQCLHSLDAQEWRPLAEDLEAGPVTLNYLWLVFPDDGTEAVPRVIEIRPNP